MLDNVIDCVGEGRPWAVVFRRARAASVARLYEDPRGRWVRPQAGGRRVASNRR